MGAQLHLRTLSIRGHALVIPVGADQSVMCWQTEQTRHNNRNRAADTTRLVRAGMHVLICPWMHALELGPPDAPVPATGVIRTGTLQLLDLEYETEHTGRPVAIYWDVLWSVPVRKGSATTTRLRPDSLAE